MQISNTREYIHLEKNSFDFTHLINSGQKRSTWFITNILSRCVKKDSSWRKRKSIHNREFQRNSKDFSRKTQENSNLLFQLLDPPITIAKQAHKHQKHPASSPHSIILIHPCIVYTTADASTSSSVNRKIHSRSSFHPRGGVEPQTARE